MKVIIYSVIVFLSFCENNFAASLQDSTSSLPDFRNISWDSSIEKVKENESSFYLQKFIGFGVETISYKDEIAGINSRVDYTFKKNKLAEGAYIIKPDDSFIDELLHLLKYLSDQFGKPEYRSGPLYNADKIWIKENDYGSYLGPSYYWVFTDGFIALLSQKFEDDITILVLFAHGSSIGRYAENNGVELDEYEFSPTGKHP
jgi:hypothetical protein